MQTDLRLMRELLKHDYAVGYVMLSWLLRCTWTITPAIALMLKLPQPAMTRAARQQLPALLAWLLHDAGQAGQSQESYAQQQHLLHQQLSAGQLKQMQEQLLGPTAAVASIASFAKTYQMLAQSHVSAQQVRMSKSVCAGTCRLSAEFQAHTQ